MTEVDDGYVGYYADRIWHLIPGVYRARDSEDPATNGPLRELVDRIAVQVAVVRRSIDRLWADQSIETSDDWVVPYIGDLLGTKLVSGLDARGRRLDVAKTIPYRRRKGTVAVLEEIARDITGWDVHVVEAFRRLSRTRHSLDPPVGPGPFAAAMPTPCPTPVVPAGTPDVQELLKHEGLLGERTETAAGGFADLRSVHGALLADSPFDEYFHTADLRRGEGWSGRYGIAKLLVFCWRLESFTVVGARPVAVDACPGDWVFDPTGRHVPLFLPPLPPEPDDYVDQWVPSQEWEVPGPLTQSVLDAIHGVPTTLPHHAPMPAETQSLALYAADAGVSAEPVEITAWPEAGQFSVAGPYHGSPLSVTYAYGFPAAIGAGPYDRTLFDDPPQTVPPETTVTGGTNLDSTLFASGGAGTVTIGDSLTYDAVADVGSTAAPIGSLLVRAGDGMRPLLRLPATAAGDPPAAWVFTGGDGANLVLDGLFVSGGDIVLRGAFASVRITGCTTDPGTLNADGDDFATSVDGRALTPTCIWVEGDPDADPAGPGAIESLVIDHSVVGPIRTRGGGAVESIAISDSIVQGIEPGGGGGLVVYDPELLVRSLAATDPVSERVFGLLSATAQGVVTSYSGGTLAASSLGKLASSLRAATTGPGLYDPIVFADVPFPPDVALLASEQPPSDVAALELGALEAAFPVALAAAALAVSAGAVELERVTVMGDVYVHRLAASDSILAGFGVVDDTQDGCVRFSAVESGSRFPRRYLSATTFPGAALFTSSSFGEPAYGQLLATADRAIASAPPAVTVTAGAESGSEMGAFSGALAPIKERGLLLKYAEYMPLGLTPVIVHVT